MLKEAGMLPLDDLGMSATLFNLNTDTRNYELDKKLDQILKELSPEKYDDETHKVKIVGADKDAKDVVNRQKKLIAEVLAELKAQGKL